MPGAKRTGAGLVRVGPPSGSKLHNKRVQYNGRWYDSKKEARYAEALDIRQAAGEIERWDKGKSVFLRSNGVQLYGPPSKKTGRSRRLYYRPDFEVIHRGGRRELIDTKGWKRGDSYARYWLKREILRSMGIEITEV